MEKPDLVTYGAWRGIHPATGKKQGLAMMRLLAATTFLLCAISGAAGETYRGDYTVSYLGLPIARSTFTSTLTGDKFRVEGTLSSSGIGAIFDSTEGKVAAAGRFKDGATVPDSFRMEYRSGGKAKRTAIRFTAGNVTATTNVPPLRQKNAKAWVLLGRDDLKAVVDPLSATLVRAKTPDEVCRRTIKVFDGEIRVDLVLQPAASDGDNASREGVMTCSVQFRPVAGYRKGKKALVYLQEKSEIVVSFAPVGSAGVYAPVYARVGTRLGPVTVHASE